MAAIAIGFAGLAQAQTTKPVDLNGRWAATIQQGQITIPFRLDISVNGDTVTGKLFNGFEDFESTSSAKLENGVLELNFEHYLTSIKANIKDGQLDGDLLVHHRSAINITPGSAEAQTKDRETPFHAVRYVPPVETASAVDVPKIDGVWELPKESPKGEKAWRLIIKQKGPEISASILRVDGDTGALTGGWKDGKFTASHFDGMEVWINDAPRANEIMVAVAVTDSGRPLPRTGGLTLAEVKGEDGLR